MNYLIVLAALIVWGMGMVALCMFAAWGGRDE